MIDSLWYGRHPLKWLLFPFSLLFRLGVAVRRWYLEAFRQTQFPVPLVVVGNITVGGVGKTPLVIELAKKFQEKGLRVGIVSRGYKAAVKNFPYEVQPEDLARTVGDEPLLLALKTQCPVVIDPNRTEAVRYLLDKHDSQIIISDDGLQHYKMGRAVEIVLIDGLRGLGNGFCLPAGPLRETRKRLSEVDFVICNEGFWDKAYTMHLLPGTPVHIKTGKSYGLEHFHSQVAAVAGIGNPQRFYATLKQLGINYKPYSYSDHFQFTANDLNYPENYILMTEKDAVKCQIFQLNNLYYLPVEAKLSDAFWAALWSHEQLKRYC